MCVNNFSEVALNSAAAGIEPAISSRKSNAITTVRHRGGGGGEPALSPPPLGDGVTPLLMVMLP